MTLKPGRGMRWLVAAGSCLLVTYVLYQITAEQTPDACRNNVAAAAIAEQGLDQGSLVDNALLQQPGCEPSVEE